MQCKPSSPAIHRLSTSAPLCNLTSHQTLLHPLCNARWDLPLEIIDLRSIHRLSKSSADHILTQSEQLLCHLPSSRILRVETRHKCSRFAPSVELCVHAALVEDRHLVGADIVLDQAAPALGVTSSREDAVLDDHLSVNRALSDDLELGAAEMNVGSVKSAWTEESNSHGRLRADKGWECLAVCEGDVASLAAFATVDVEVEEEGGVVGKKGDAVCGGVGERELSREGEGGVVPLGDGRGDGGGSKGEDGCGDEWCELHFGGLGWW
jgi:hypothetical protein